MARPRAGSPAVPVSEFGMALPTIRYGRNASCAGAALMAPVAIAAASAALAPDFARDRPEPGFSIDRLGPAEVGRRRGRADAARTFDLGQHVVHRPIHA